MAAKKWKDVVLSTPHLWTRIRTAMLPADLTLALRLSKQAPLDVSDFPPGPSSNIFFNLIAPHSARIRSLVTSYTRPWLLSRMLNNTPLLEKLRIAVDLGVDLELGDEGARLRELIVKTPVTWMSKRLSGLTTLMLSRIQGPSAPTLQQLFHILTASPRMETFILDNVNVQNEPTADARLEDTAVFLGQLRSLEIEDIPPFALCALLARIHAPTLDFLNMENWASSRNCDHAPSAFADSVRDLLQQKAGSIELSIDSDCLGLDTDELFHLWLSLEKDT